MKSLWIAAAVCLFAIPCIAATVSAREPGWTSAVVPRGRDAQVRANTPVLNRPYRPLHVYGNTLRRAHYRGNPLPTTRDVGKTTQRLLYRGRLFVRR